MEIVISLVIIILDRISKILAKNYLLPVNSIPLIKGVFNLTYTQNTGAAFSIFSKHTSLLSIFTFIVVIIGIIFYLKVKKLNPTKKWFLMSIVWILAGAVGNLIDRVLYSYVIDYFDFCLINFAIFNVADCFITVGGIILGACLIFDKDITI